MMPLISNIFSI
jgi:hypothetical protein